MSDTACANCGHPAYFHENASCDYDTDAGTCECNGYAP